MFKIRKKKKGAQPMEQDLQPMEGVVLTVLTLLSAVTTLLRCQVILAQYQSSLPNLRDAFAPLVETQPTVPLATLVEHAKRHALITDEQAVQLLSGEPIEIETIQQKESSR